MLIVRYQVQPEIKDPLAQLETLVLQGQLAQTAQYLVQLEIQDHRAK